MKKPWLDHEKEKREHPRIDLDTSVEVHKENFGGSHEGRIHDISSNGIRITTELSINENEDIVIHLQNPKNQQKVTIIGEVCWMEDTSESRVQAGIQFHPLDGQSVIKLKQLLREASGNPAIGQDSKPQHFADAPSLEQEISKILEDPATNTSPQESSPPPVKTDAPPSKLMSSQNTPEEEDIPSGSRVRFFTFFLFFLFAGLAAGTWWLQQQNQLEASLHKAKEAISITIRDSGLLEQDIQPGKPTPPEPSLPSSAENKKDDIVAHTKKIDGQHLLTSEQGIQRIQWTGQPEKLTLTINFDQLAADTDYQIQKLDFDLNNLRYLIKLPIAQSKLEQNNYSLNHPLVQQVRVGIHTLETGPSLHLVLDMQKAKGEIVSDHISNNQLILELVSFE